MLEFGVRLELKPFIEYIYNVFLSQLVKGVRGTVYDNFGDGPDDWKTELKFDPASGEAKYKGVKFALPPSLVFKMRLYEEIKPRREEIVSDVFEFLVERLKVQQREAGVRHDLIDAVFALGGEDDLVRLLARVSALQAFVETGEGTNLLAAYKRASNILKKEHWDLPRVMATRGEQGIPQTGEEDPLSMVEEPAIAEAVAAMARGSAAPLDAPAEELALTEALNRAEPLATVAIAGEDFTAAMAALASLRAPIDAFFEKVIVNDPDGATRARRLNVLARFRDAVHRVADFSRIEG